MPLQMRRDGTLVRLDRIRHDTSPSVLCTTDPAKVIADPLAEAVVIATPTNTHFAIAKEALEAGKPWCPKLSVDSHFNYWWQFFSRGNVGPEEFIRERTASPTWLPLTNTT